MKMPPWASAIVNGVKTAVRGGVKAAVTRNPASGAAENAPTVGATVDAVRAGGKAVKKKAAAAKDAVRNVFVGPPKPPKGSLPWGLLLLAGGGALLWFTRSKGGK